MPSIAVAQQAQNDTSGSGPGSIFHTAVVGSYGFWVGQPSELDDNKWGYGATVRYFSGGLPLGVGVSWMRHKLDVSGTYRTESEAFRNQLTLDRLGVDLYYRLPPNARGNVPYLLAGGGQVTAKGDLAGGGNGEATGGFWEAGMGIINGGSRYTAFSLELKYIGSLDDKVRQDDGIIELSLSMGYNW
ncbi:hypothetical protein [Thiohalorhabdus sp.]|uniref:hypothetical protein n=1 Tax=Thiohalorhabdus sp. TaxID=3094134 RepID=UPI002FC2C802